MPGYLTADTPVISFADRIPVSNSSRTELVDLIRSSVGPWQTRSIEQQDRKTLERLARLALRSRNLVAVRHAGPVSESVTAPVQFTPQV